MRIDFKTAAILVFVAGFAWLVHEGIVGGFIRDLSGAFTPGHAAPP